MIKKRAFEDATDLPAFAEDEEEFSKDERKKPFEGELNMNTALPYGT